MKRRSKQLFFSLSFTLGLSSISVFAATTTFPSLSSLGEQLFSDTNLSLTGTQSCASCHNPEQGFIDTRENGVESAVSLGHDGVSLGHRNAPTISYAALSPRFTGSNANNASGGQFWDGRAGNLSDQAEAPPLSEVEMGMLSKADVVSRLQENSEYVEAFKSYFGENIFDDTDTAYTAMASSLAAFEQSPAVSPFDSKFDRSIIGEYRLTQSEMAGRNLFFSRGNSCVRCHSSGQGQGQAQPPRQGQRGAGAPQRPPRGATAPPRGMGNVAVGQVFSNFRYFNNGTPSNIRLNSILQSTGQQSEFLATGDLGLFANPSLNGDRNSRGRFKVSTLRNIAVTAPYMHNGVFKTLKTVLEFYDHQGGNPLRINNPETGMAWQNAETPQTVDRRRLRIQNNFSDVDINNLECFLRTLTDQKFEQQLPPLRDGLGCS